MESETLLDLPNVFTHADAIGHGISERRLAQMHRNGEIDRLARGIYLKPDADVDPDLAEIAIRAPQATLCLTTALARHDLVDDIPPSINAALPRRQRPPRTAAPVTWHRFDNTTFDIGRTQIGLNCGMQGPTKPNVRLLGVNSTVWE